MYNVCRDGKKEKMNACLLQFIVPALTLLAAIGTLIVAIYIPHRIMVNQLYANLVADYRSPEMGAAILALFHFFVKECDGDVSVIDEKYREKYEEQIGKCLNSDSPINFSQTLHFQRRLVAQFYYNMAALHFKRRRIYRFKKKDLKKWFTQDESKLLSIVLHMAEPASKVFIRAGNIPKPPQNEVHMDRLLYRLYKKTKKF